jgi:hypothetical protein
MAERTFIPTLVEIVRRLCIYITRYSKQLRDNMPSDWLPAFEALELACHAFLAIADVPVNP